MTEGLKKVVKLKIFARSWASKAREALAEEKDDKETSPNLSDPRSHNMLRRGSTLRTLNAGLEQRDVEIRRFCVTVQKTKKVLLDNIDAKFRAGSLTAIMGCSGAGKTTLLRAVGMRAADSLVTTGSIQIGSIKVSANTKQARIMRAQVGFVPQVI